MSDPLKTQIRDYFVYVHERQRAAAATALQEPRVAEQPVQAPRTVGHEEGEPWPEFEGGADDSRPSVWDVLTRPRVFTALMAVVAVPVAIALVLILSSADADPPPGAERVGQSAAGRVGGAPGVLEHSSVLAAAWSRVDLPWVRVPDDGSVFGRSGRFRDHRMNDVISGGPGLVAVGSTPEGQRDDVAVWTSFDGLSWSRVPQDGLLGGVGSQAMSSVTVGGPGLVAVGSDYSAGVGLDAAVWTSLDGVSWSRVAQDAVLGGVGSQAMSSVTVGGPGLVAVGFDDPDGVESDGLSVDAAVWTSVDGIGWSRVPRDEAVFGGEGDQRMNSVTTGGPGLVAVGADGDEAAVWTSVDGLVWSRVRTAAGVVGPVDDWLGEMNAVTVGGPGLVAVGSQPSSDPSSRPSDAAVWTSVDGIGWSRVADEALSGREFYQAMSDVTVVGAGLVAVGMASYSRSFDLEAAVWTSVDGLSWTQVPHDPSVFGGDGFQGMGSVTIGGPGLVAVGGDGLAPAAWTASE